LRLHRLNVAIVGARLVAPGLPSRGVKFPLGATSEPLHVSAPFPMI